MHVCVHVLDLAPAQGNAEAQYLRGKGTEVVKQNSIQILCGKWIYGLLVCFYAQSLKVCLILHTHILYLWHYCLGAYVST